MPPTWFVDGEPSSFRGSDYFLFQAITKALAAGSSGVDRDVIVKAMADLYDATKLIGGPTFGNYADAILRALNTAAPGGGRPFCTMPDDGDHSFCSHPPICSACEGTGYSTPPIDRTPAPGDGEAKSDWFAGDVDSEGNELITVRKDEWDRFKALENGPPYASDSWDVDGYASPAEEINDMANVGRSLLHRIASVVCSPGPFKGWSPMDDPSEIVTDMANALDEAALTNAGRGSVVDGYVDTCDQMERAAAIADRQDEVERLIRVAMQAEYFAGNSWNGIRDTERSKLAKSTATAIRALKDRK